MMNNNCKYDFTCAAPCALRWVKECFDRRNNREEPWLMRALHVLHHRPLDLHLLQAVSFEVPLHRVREALRVLEERVPSMPAQVFNVSPSDGFPVVHPLAREEHYNSMGYPQRLRKADESGSPAKSVNAAAGKEENAGGEAAWASSSSTPTSVTGSVDSQSVVSARNCFSPQKSSQPSGSEEFCGQSSDGAEWECHDQKRLSSCNPLLGSAKIRRSIA